MNIFLTNADGDSVPDTNGSVVDKGYVDDVEGSNMIYIVVWVLAIIGDDAERAS